MREGRLPVHHLGEEGEVIDTRGPGDDAGGAYAQHPGDAHDPDGHLVAHADVANGASFVDGQGDSTHGVREIHQEGSGAVPFDVCADAERILDAAQGVEHRPGTAVLAVDLGRAVSTRDLVVLSPVGEAAKLGAGDAEVRPLEGLGRVGHLLEYDGRAVGGVEPSGEAVGTGESRCVEVVEHQPGPGELGGVDDIVDHGGTEGQPPRPDEGDLRLLHRRHSGPPGLSPRSGAEAIDSGRN